MPVPKSPGLSAICIVLDAKMRVLLVRRKFPPFKGEYALPGGYVEIGETVEDACRRELMEETAVEAGALRLVGVYSDPKRNPMRHTCGVAFLTRVRRATAKAGDDAAEVAWVEDWAKMRLAFDHTRILADAVRLARRRG